MIILKIISLKEVELKLMNNNLKKATGPDDLPNWILGDLSCIIAPPICAIFNQSIRECKLPIEWKKANVTPIPKVHPPRSIQSDARPISLTPTVSKYLESFIRNYILENIKGSDHAGTFMSLNFVVYYANHRSWHQSSKIQVVIGVQNFRVSIFHFSYREFHEFCTKTINDNDIFSIDEKNRLNNFRK